MFMPVNAHDYAECQLSKGSQWLNDVLETDERGMNRSHYLASPHQSPATIIYTYSFLAFCFVRL